MTDQRDIRLKRLAMRSWRRGTKEMDMILGPFADTGMAKLSDERLDQYETLLEEADQDLYMWMSNQQEIPTNIQEIVNIIKDFHDI